VSSSYIRRRLSYGEVPKAAGRLTTTSSRSDGLRLRGPPVSRPSANGKKSRPTAVGHFRPFHPLGCHLELLLIPVLSRRLVLPAARSQAVRSGVSR